MPENTENEGVRRERGERRGRDDRRGKKERAPKADFSREAPYTKENHLKRVRIIADYQFGKGAGDGLFPEECEFRLSATKRVRYVMLGNDRIATLRAGDGRLTLGNTGAKRLFDLLGAPHYRVVVKNEVAEFVAAGKNAMAKHVVSADEKIRADDEVLVCDEDGHFLATGSAVLSASDMAGFKYGVAVSVRKGN